MTNGMKFEKITIKGKEYEFLKPKPIQLIDIEDSCYEPDKKGNLVMNAGKYSDEMLKIIDPDLKKEDLVKFEPVEVKLNSGKTVKAIDIGYDRWDKARETFVGKVSRKKMAMMFVEASGLHPYDPIMHGQMEITENFVVMSDLTYAELTDLAEGFSVLYDDSELLEVLEGVAGFLHSETQD